MKKLSNSETKFKKGVAYKKKVCNSLIIKVVTSKFKFHQINFMEMTCFSIPLF